MKIANVVSVQDRDSFVEPASSGSVSARLGRMADLLRAYPDIPEAGRVQLLEFLTTGAPEEVAQVTHMQGLEQRVAAFRKAHPRDFPQGFGSWVPMIVIGLVMLATVAWLVSYSL